MSLTADGGLSDLLEHPRQLAERTAERDDLLAQQTAAASTPRPAISRRFDAMLEKPTGYALRTLACSALSTANAFGQSRTAAGEFPKDPVRPHPESGRRPPRPL